MTKKSLEATAAVLMLAVLGCIALVYWAGNARNAAAGPASITRDAQDRVWLVADRKLFILDAEGRLVLSAPLVDLGMDESVSAVAGLPEGGAVAGSYDLGLLYLLDTTGKVTRTIDPATTPAGHFRQGLALLGLRGRMLVAHIGHHRLLALDSAGTVLARAGSLDGEPGDFHFPNNVTLGDDGLLYVADTNHHEVEVLKDDLQRARDPIRTPRVAGANWPVAAVRLPTGDLAVTILNNGMRRGAVALVDGNGKLTRQLELQDGAEPLELLAREADLLVCDQHATRYQVRRFDHAGDYAGEFGDAAFLAAMREASGRNRLYGHLRSGGQFGALLAAVALLLVYRRSRELEDAGRDAALGLPQLPAAPWLEHARFYAAIGWPLLPAILLIGFGEVQKGSGHLALVVVLLGVVLLLWGVRQAMINMQHPRFAALLRAQKDKQIRARLKSLSWWGAKEPVLAGAPCFYKRQAVLVLVSPVRVALVPPLGARSIKIITLKELATVEETRPELVARMVSAGTARALTLHYNDPAPSTVTLSFAFLADFELVKAALASAHQKWRAGAATPAAASAGPSSARSGWSASSPAPARPARAAWSSVLLSAVLPGLGHLNQRRQSEGMLWLSGFGFLAVTIGLEWFVHLARITQVDRWMLLGSTATLVVVWLAALGDVIRYEGSARQPGV